MDRAWVAALRAETDAAQKLRRYAEHLLSSMARTAPILLLARSASGLDADMAAVWQQLQDERLIGMTAFAADLASTGQLRPGLPVGEVRDVLWTLNSVSLYELLVLERGWSAERYRDFAADALIAALVDPGAGPA
jgi:hypothetical protein